MNNNKYYLVLVVDEKDPRANTKDGNGGYYIGKDSSLLDFFNDVCNKVSIDRHVFQKGNYNYNNNNNNNITVVVITQQQQ